MLATTIEAKDVEAVHIRSLLKPFVSIALEIGSTDSDSVEKVECMNELTNNLKW